MKKLALTVAIVLGLGMATYAQGGGLFGQGEAVEESAPATLYNRSGIPGMPGGHGGNADHPAAPLGSGIAVLVGLGAAYAFAKKREE